MFDRVQFQVHNITQITKIFIVHFGMALLSQFLWQNLLGQQLTQNKFEPQW